MPLLLFQQLLGDLHWYCLISYGYIKMLGANGLKQATKIAILNANYIKSSFRRTL